MTRDYAIKAKDNGLYAFILNGDVKINGHLLHSRDGFGTWMTDKIKIEAESDAEFLIMDVPMIS